MTTLYRVWIEFVKNCDLWVFILKIDSQHLVKLLKIKHKCSSSLLFSFSSCVWWCICIVVWPYLNLVSWCCWSDLHGGRFVAFFLLKSTKSNAKCQNFRHTNWIMYLFMNLGSSAPELGTVIIGVFFAKDDIGVSGVIGSAVFNIMFVISVCALFSGTVCHLNWWPLVRDCFFYSLSIIVMLIIMLNDYISWVSESDKSTIKYKIFRILINDLFGVVFCIWLNSMRL